MSFAKTSACRSRTDRRRPDTDRPGSDTSAPGSDTGRRGQSPGKRSPDTGKRMSSIARSIALSSWLDRLSTFVVIDLVLCAVIAGVFAYRCVMQIPVEAREGMSLSPGQTLRIEGGGLQISPTGLDAGDTSLVIVDALGQEHSFSLDEPLVYAIPTLAGVLIIEVIALLGGLSEARRIRRKLRPLNELALAADAIGSVDESAKFASLEHAISEISVEAPRVSTGDKDLLSIEAALNGLLRRMQEAKQQQARFVSDASHELRTPIAVIQGYVNMLDRWGKTDEAVLDESIAALKSESAHMQELVEQLLFLARGDSGRNALERTTFDLVELADEIATESRMIDQDHRYVTTQPLSHAPLRMVGDRAMVKQALRIIVQNAARYSEAGTTIEISARHDPAHNRVGCAVRDEGMGIDQADASHIFERFYRSDTARGSHKEGSGLGLSIAQWIADAHDGQIDVLSRKDVGTRFTVWFPAARVN